MDKKYSTEEMCNAITLNGECLATEVGEAIIARLREADEGDEAIGMGKELIVGLDADVRKLESALAREKALREQVDMARDSFRHECNLEKAKWVKLREWADSLEHMEDGDMILGEMDELDREGKEASHE